MSESAVFPWRYEIPATGVLTVRDIKQAGDMRGFDVDPERMVPVAHMPYFFARPEAISYLSASGTTRHLLATQNLFLQRYAPNNIPLLHRFFADYAAKNPNRAHRKMVAPTWEIEDPRWETWDPIVEDPQSWIETVIDHFGGNGYHAVRDVIKTNRERLLQVQSLEEMARAIPDTGYFLRHIFYPGLRGPAVHLPVGLVLFEGRGVSTRYSGDAASSVAARVLSDTTRREPFSTSWHPNAAISFLRPGGKHTADIKDSTVVDRNTNLRVLVVHKVMSPDILAVDVQSQDTEPPAHFLYHECEIIVQPFVKLHVVEQAAHLLHYNVAYLDHQGRTKTLLANTLFTHLFTGDACPCGQHAMYPPQLASAASAAAASTQ